MVGEVVFVVVFGCVRRMWDGWLVVGLCCDCCSAGWWCLIADWTLDFGERAVTCVFVWWAGANEQTFDEGTFLSRYIRYKQ